MNNEETLAAVSGQGQSRVPSLILLKEGSQSPPIFIAHGLGSTVADLIPLASHLPVSHPIYGLQERGMDGFDAPLDRIEAMAEFHLKAIRQLQPHGPYFLIGYSFGGLVSLEIARRLSTAGEPIELLALLDSYPYRRYLPLPQRLRLLVRLAKLRLALILRATGTEGEATPQLQRVKYAQLLAWRNYRPRFYDGKINFVKATIDSFLPDDPVAAWTSLVKEIRVETVPGDHLAMLTTHAEAVAYVLLRYLEEAGVTGSSGD
jgi:acetoacetyl-CoA synthetase